MLPQRSPVAEECPTLKIPAIYRYPQTMMIYLEDVREIHPSKIRANSSHIDFKNGLLTIADPRSFECLHQLLVSAALYLYFGAKCG